MSSPDLPVRLSLKAKQDFIDILRYTGETWGPKQLQAYRDKIDSALQLIGRTPEIGRSDGDEAGANRVFLVVDVVVYRIEPTRVGVIRILHQRMLGALHVGKGYQD
jgi:plasmid stabilization system protein ParE